MRKFRLALTRILSFVVVLSLVSSSLGQTINNTSGWASGSQIIYNQNGTSILRTGSFSSNSYSGDWDSEANWFGEKSKSSALNVSGVPGSGLDCSITVEGSTEIPSGTSLKDFKYGATQEQNFSVSGSGTKIMGGTFTVHRQTGVTVEEYVSYAKLTDTYGHKWEIKGSVNSNALTVKTYKNGSLLTQSVHGFTTSGGVKKAAGTGIIQVPVSTGTMSVYIHGRMRIDQASGTDKNKFVLDFDF